MFILLSGYFTYIILSLVKNNSIRTLRIKEVKHLSQFIQQASAEPGFKLTFLIMSHCLSISPVYSLMFTEHLKCTKVAYFKNLHTDYLSFHYNTFIHHLILTRILWDMYHLIPPFASGETKVPEGMFYHRISGLESSQVRIPTKGAHLHSLHPWILHLEFSLLLISTHFQWLSSRIFTKTNTFQL